MSIDANNPTNLILPNWGTNQGPVTQVPERDLNDGKKLMHDDMNQSVKLRILQYQLAKSVIENERADITQSLLMRTTGDMDKPIAEYNEDVMHFAASINKLAVAYLLLQDLDNGDRTKDEMIPLPPNAERIAGAGKYDRDGEMKDATEAKLGDLLFDLLNQSGNTAVRVLVNSMGGANAVNDRFATIPQIPNTRLILLADPNRFYLGNTTSAESLFVLEQIYKQPGENGEFLRHALETNIFGDFGVRSQIGDTETITLTNKLGLLNDPAGNNRHDLGIIKNTKTGKTFSYAIMTTSPSDSQTATGRAEESIQEMGRNLLRYAGDKRDDHRHDIKRQSPQTMDNKQKSATQDQRIIY